ncbi:uncharacterized protein BXZ73DRAFT_78010 [Epithele typhae]|uniref:uncharacterized protein n=1 Tax=Epithele typhae TaxID=378194 RepID=UPI002008AE07|nr:uncharacterized protein BXZ73DRAFT_78010 [Epithele typhae]KAH9929901.1 hypothetical protein BXZ73DRAFT_78010 [Epithele typhae]
MSLTLPKRLAIVQEKAELNFNSIQDKCALIERESEMRASRQQQLEAPCQLNDGPPTSPKQATQINATSTQASLVTAARCAVSRRLLGAKMWSPRIPTGPNDLTLIKILVEEVTVEASIPRKASTKDADSAKEGTGLAAGIPNPPPAALLAPSPVKAGGGPAPLGWVARAKGISGAMKWKNSKHLLPLTGWPPLISNFAFVLIPGLQQQGHNFMLRSGPSGRA